jgi:CubicO group peptidase (beta-lactamase class C family)
MKSIYSIALITLLPIFIGCTTSKAPKVPQNIEKGDYTHVKEYMRWYIKEQMEKHDIVGLSIALVDDQTIVWQEGFGYEDKKNKIKATPKTRYWAGSITKLFTAMGTMKLVEEGKVDIDKPFKTYLPEFSIKSRFGSTDDITPRTIMTHHSGLPGDWLDGMFSLNPTNYTEQSA